jgi:hypothetical protein
MMNMTKTISILPSLPVTNSSQLGTVKKIKLSRRRGKNEEKSKKPTYKLMKIPSFQDYRLQPSKMMRDYPAESHKNGAKRCNCAGQNTVASDEPINIKSNMKIMMSDKSAKDVHYVILKLFGTQTLKIVLFIHFLLNIHIRIFCFIFHFVRIRIVFLPWLTTTLYCCFFIILK